MALHSDGGKHGWGSASLPATVWKDTDAVVAIATTLAQELEKNGVLNTGEWSVPEKYAHHSDGAGAGCIHEPDGSSIDYQANEFAVIETPTGYISIHAGEKYVWVQFQKTQQVRWVYTDHKGNTEEMVGHRPERKCLKLPRSAF